MDTPACAWTLPPGLEGHSTSQPPVWPDDASIPHRDSRGRPIRPRRTRVPDEAAHRPGPVSAVSAAVQDLAVTGSDQTNWAYLDGALSLAPPPTSTLAPVQGLPVSFSGSRLSSDGSAVHVSGPASVTLDRHGPVTMSLASSSSSLSSSSSAFVPSLDSIPCPLYQSSPDELRVECRWHGITSVRMADAAHGPARPVVAPPSVATMADRDHKQAARQMSIDDGISATELRSAGPPPAYVDPLDMSRASSDLVLPLSVHSVPAGGGSFAPVTSGESWETLYGGPVDSMCCLAIPTSRSSSVDGTETLLAALVGPREPDPTTSPAPRSNDLSRSEDCIRCVRNESFLAAPSGRHQSDGQTEP